MQIVDFITARRRANVVHLIKSTRRMARIGIFARTVFILMVVETHQNGGPTQVSFTQFIKICKLFQFNFSKKKPKRSGWSNIVYF